MMVRVMVRAKMKIPPNTSIDMITPNTSRALFSVLTSIAQEGADTEGQSKTRLLKGREAQNKAVARAEAKKAEEKGRSGPIESG